MNKRCISQECLETTGFSYTLSLINGKYKMTILYTLMEFGIVRFNEMKKSPDPAQSGVQPYRARKIPDPYPGRDVRMGR